MNTQLHIDPTKNTDAEELLIKLKDWSHNPALANGQDIDELKGACILLCREVLRLKTAVNYIETEMWHDS